MFCLDVRKSRQATLGVCAHRLKKIFKKSLKNYAEWAFRHTTRHHEVFREGDPVISAFSEISSSEACIINKVGFAIFEK